MPQFAKVFRSGNSQAVRLPKDFRFDVEECLLEARDFRFQFRDGAMQLAALGARFDLSFAVRFGLLRCAGR